MSLAAKEQAKKEGLSIREAEYHLDTELFLDKYLWWDVGGQHHPFILQRMFMHVTESGWKEAERLIHCGCWCGLPGLDPKVDISAIQLMGYQTSQEEIGELFHEVYMLKRLPTPHCVGPNEHRR